MKQVTDWRKNVAGYFVLDAEKDVINAVYLSEVNHGMHDAIVVCLLRSCCREINSIHRVRFTSCYVFNVLTYNRKK